MTLTELNNLDQQSIKEALLKCCGSTKWAEKMSELFPIPDVKKLIQQAESIWYRCDEKDWKEAFSCHPRIGDIDTLREKFASTSKWAEGEQAAIKETPSEVLRALAEGNRLYEEKFGYIFIVCATGKTAEEMLGLLRDRLLNKRDVEIMIAMEEQNKITQLRLHKLLSL